MSSFSPGSFADIKTISNINPSPKSYNNLKNCLSFIPIISPLRLNSISLFVNLSIYFPSNRILLSSEFSSLTFLYCSFFRHRYIQFQASQISLSHFQIYFFKILSIRRTRNPTNNRLSCSFRNWCYSMHNKGRENNDGSFFAWSIHNFIIDHKL